MCVPSVLPLSSRLAIAAFLLSVLAFPARAEKEIPLWKDGAPGLRHEKPESVEDKRETGRQDRYLSYVSTPTLTLFPATGPSASKTMVLVIPGGGFRAVCIDKEGYEVAQWLNSIGVSAAVLKYRTTDPEKPRNAATIEPVLVDPVRAMRVLRSNASEFGIEPQRIGVIGFSAGAVMAIRLFTDADEGSASATDPIEKISSRPDFIALVYGTVPPGKAPTLSKHTPPIFIAHASDDPKASPAVMAKFYEALLQAGVSAELHAFHRGDHGFGIQPKEGSVRAWPTLWAQWMRDQGFVGQ